MIAGFLAWWKEQLLSLRPELASTRRGDAVCAALRGTAVDVSVRRGGKLGRLGAFTLDSAGMAALASALARVGGTRRPPVELLLPPGTLLTHEISLPLAAERDPAAVLRYEMDRLTPFAASELYWDYAIERRDKARSQLRLSLWLVLRAQLAGVLEALGSAGLQVATLLAEGPGARAIRLDAARTAPWRERVATGLVLACAVLAVAAAAIPFIEQSRAMDAVERQIAVLKPAVDRSEALRRGMASASAVVDVLASQRATVGDPLAILAALTDILPDDTVLNDLSLRQRVIAMSGQSGAAARLIPALAADPALRDPAFTAPVTRNEVNHTDGFTIRALAASPAEMVARAAAQTGPNGQSLDARR